MVAGSLKRKDLLLAEARNHPNCRVSYGNIWNNRFDSLAREFTESRPIRPPNVSVKSALEWRWGHSRFMYFAMSVERECAWCPWVCA
jgi:hypothetical protein